MRAIALTMVKQKGTITLSGSQLFICLTVVAAGFLNFENINRDKNDGHKQWKLKEQAGGWDWVYKSTGESIPSDLINSYAMGLLQAMLNT